MYSLVCPDALPVTDTIAPIAMSKYGRADGRTDGFTDEERIYLQTALDPKLMQLLHYPQI
jgi:hypothetical protein